MPSNNKMPQLLLFVLLASLLVQCSAQSNLRSLVEEKDSPTIDCRYVRGDIRYEDGTTEAFDACEDGQVLYDLPSDMLTGVNRRDHLHSGATHLQIKGAKEVTTLDTTETDHIQVTDDDLQVHVVNDEEPSNNNRDLKSVTNNKIISTTGRKTLMVVRVTSLDAQVNITSQQLQESTFGSGVSVATQYHRCSNGKLEFVPAQGPNIVNGVGELKLDLNTRGVASKNLATALREKFVTLFGSEDKYDLITYCLPEGTGEDGRFWVAYAYRDTKFSYYNNEWCASLTSRLHELGHNIGLGHSGEHYKPEDGGEAVFQSYEDRTCNMGASFRRMDGPQYCFNGFRNWALGWFHDRQTSVDPVLSGSWGGHVAAFVDYDDMKSGDFAIINVRDVYVQFNLADKHNWEVGERPNQVTIVQQQGDAEEPSELLGGIDMHDTTFEYKHADGDVIVFQACQQGEKPGARGGVVRYFKISIHEKGKTSACGIEDPPPSDLEELAKKRQKRTYSKPEYDPTDPKRVKRTSILPVEESTSCEDSTLPFKIGEKQVTCDVIAKEPALKSTHCSRGDVAYIECRKTCNSCGYVAKSSSTTLTTSTLHGSPRVRLWDINYKGNA